MVNFSQATIVNNLVVGNAAGCGGGFYWGGSTGVTTFVNNTFADNDGAEGSAIEVSGVDTRHVIYNNVIIGKAGQTAFYCRNSSSTPSPVVNTSNVFSAAGPRVRRDVPGSDRPARKHLGRSAVRAATPSPTCSATTACSRPLRRSMRATTRRRSSPRRISTATRGSPTATSDGDARVDMGAYESRPISLPSRTPAPIKPWRPTRAASRSSRWTAAPRRIPTAIR